MADPILPTPQDAQLLLQDTTTKTASYSTPSVDLGAAPGGLGRPAAAIVHATAVDTADGNETYTVVLQDSNDNITFLAAGAAVSLGAAGAHAVRGWITRRYARVALTIAGTTPSMTFKAWLNPLP